MKSRIFKQFWRNEVGAIYIYFAIAIIPILGFVGLSVDISRAYHARAILVDAVDAASIAAAKVTPDQANAEAHRIFNAYISGTSIAGGADITNVEVNSDEGYVQVNAESTVDMSFIKAIGYDYIDVGAESRVVIAGGVIEVALVLDNTGSMRHFINGKSRLDHLKDSVELLVNTLMPTDDPTDDVFISIVPYITQVNTGIRTDWLTVAGKARVNDPNFFPNIPAGNWQGCLEARLHNNLHSSDTPPTDEATRFMPYWWASTEIHNYPYPSGSINPWGTYYAGDNDWTLTSVTPWTSSNPINPNAGCPVEVLPLSNYKKAILAKNQEMRWISRGGTFSFAGLKVGWWTLSPKWKGMWHSPNPNDLPKEYEDSKKVIVLMTDGHSEWIAMNAPYWFYDDYNYTSYGRWYGSAHSSNNQSIVQPNSMNTYTIDMCDKVKQEGITIYAITFGVWNQAARDVLSACASDPSGYYDASSADELSDAFADIAEKVQKLRYSWPQPQQL